MNIRLRKQRNLAKDRMAQALLSPNSHLIVMSNFQNNFFICSSLLLKQIRKLSLNSHNYSFSPSSQQLAFGGVKGELQIQMVGSHQLVYKNLLSNIAWIQYIKYKNENTLIAASASYLSSQIFQVDVKNKQITQIVQIGIYNSSLAYSHNHDALLFVERETNYLQIWSVQEGYKLFQSDPFSQDQKAIQLVDSKNLILVQFFYSQMIYLIDYGNKQIQPYQYQIPKSIHGYTGSRIFDDLIVTISTYNKNNPQVTGILLDQIDCPQTITKWIKLQVDLKVIQSFKVQNRLFLTIAAEHQQKYYFYFIRIHKI